MRSSSSKLVGAGATSLRPSPTSCLPEAAEQRHYPSTTRFSALSTACQGWRRRTPADAAAAERFAERLRALEALRHPDGTPDVRTVKALPRLVPAEHARRLPLSTYGPAVQPTLSCSSQGIRRRSTHVLLAGQLEAHAQAPHAGASVSTTLEFL